MIMYVLFFIIAFIWLGFLIGYPIYKKIIKKETFDWLWYALWCNVIALFMNIINLVIKLFNIGN